MIEIKKGDASYSPGPSLVLRGTGRLGEGEMIKISMGETVVVGRSRHCDWSLKRSPGYLKSEGDEREAITKSLEFRSVSRQHLRIAFLAEDMVELENLSANGTFLDGNRLDRIVLRDCLERTHAIRLGPKGVLLELAPGSLPTLSAGRTGAAEEESASES